MNKVYPLAKQALMEYAFNGTTPAGVAEICIIAVDNTYVYSDAHDSLADVSGGSIVGPETVLDNVVLSLGVLDADDAAMTGMTVSETVDAFIIYAKWASATLLLSYMDTPTNGSIPQSINSPSGLVQFDASGIFEI